MLRFEHLEIFSELFVIQINLGVEQLLLQSHGDLVLEEVFLLPSSDISRIIVLFNLKQGAVHRISSHLLLLLFKIPPLDLVSRHHRSFAFSVELLRVEVLVVRVLN
uniref:Uncharacterized protein n=1 Tax=Strombidium inclinatum TaxID=197538 RepID=A0A7S3INX3_9SPIT|mmetsp:Transcript_28810/g.43498  ORF Transcript_28810/g.43498 Transcript_28810/m.43498 type:complete len:106 (+) Transcript_28810:1226-1543(+)